MVKLKHGSNHSPTDVGVGGHASPLPPEQSCPRYWTCVRKVWHVVATSLVETYLKMLSMFLRKTSDQVSLFHTRCRTYLKQAPCTRTTLFCQRIRLASPTVLGSSNTSHSATPGHTKAHANVGFSNRRLVQRNTSVDGKDTASGIPNPQRQH